MKFSIQEEGQIKQIFFTFREASEKTGILSKTINRVLKSGNRKYFRRSDKKTFWIQEEESSPFIQIDGEDFFSADEIQGRFGVSRTSFFSQLAKKKTHFLDSQEKSHEVTWKSEMLESFLSRLRESEAVQKVMSSQKRKICRKVMLNDRVKLMIKWIFDLIQFDKPATAEEVQRLEKLNIILKSRKKF